MVVIFKHPTAFQRSAIIANHILESLEGFFVYIKILPVFQIMKMAFHRSFFSTHKVRPATSITHTKMLIVRINATSKQQTTIDCSTHNARQAAYFANQVNNLGITPQVDTTLAKIVSSIPGLNDRSRVLDVGAGDGALLPHLNGMGVRDILAVDVCPEMLAAIHTKYPPNSQSTEDNNNSNDNNNIKFSSDNSPHSTLGNIPALRTWCGDVMDLPDYMGPFDVVFCNAVYGNLHNPREALLKLLLMTKPGGYVVISHPLGSKWHQKYSAANPDIVPHPLPSEASLESDILYDLPAKLVQFIDNDEIYLTILQVPENYALTVNLGTLEEEAANAAAVPVVYLDGEIVAGFGRGSRQLGVPTANLDPVLLGEKLAELPVGVYFGWAKVDCGPGAPAEDSKVHKMVMNIGKRPTFENGDGDGESDVSVEVHIMHNYQGDFYGKDAKVVVLGYIRPEVKFAGIQELLRRIHADIGIARSQLDSERWAKFQEDPWLK